MTIELARAAQSGDDAAFVLLIEEHMAGMRAVAIALLGYVDEADDVVQDAVLTALRRLPELRDPAAAGPWLRAVVRNNCRMLLRSRRAVPVAEPEPLLPADAAPGPDESFRNLVAVQQNRADLCGKLPRIGRFPRGRRTEDEVDGLGVEFARHAYFP